MAPARQPEATPETDAGELLGWQRTQLRGLAHPLRPLVEIGRAGLTDALIEAVNQALVDHELIKVRLFTHEEKHVVSEALAQRVNAQLCGLVGKMVILFRPDTEHPGIVFRGRHVVRLSRPKRRAQRTDDSAQRSDERARRTQPSVPRAPRRKNQAPR